MLPSFWIVSSKEEFIFYLTSLKVIYFLLQSVISSYILCFVCVAVDGIFKLHRFWMQLMMNPGVLTVQHWLRLHRPLKNSTDLFVTLHS